MLRYFTSGESHGEALVAFLSGLPAGLAWWIRHLWIATLAAPAGLWTRRAHEDRNRPGAFSLGRAPWQDDRLANRGDAGESRLAELERIAAGGEGDPEKHKRVASPRPAMPTLREL
jgi:chorismate synthase